MTQVLEGIIFQAFKHPGSMIRTPGAPAMFPPLAGYVLKAIHLHGPFFFFADLARVLIIFKVDLGLSALLPGILQAYLWIDS